MRQRSKEMGKLDALKSFMGCREMSYKNQKLWKAVLAEFVGTFLLVLLACFSCLEINGQSYSAGEIAICFGLVVASVAQSIGHVSGCHINPAVTFGMLVTGKINLLRGFLYVAAQCIGSVGGSAVMKAIVPMRHHGLLGMTTIHPEITPIQGFGLEFFITFLLVLVVFGACDEKRSDVKGSVPLAIGLAVSAGHFVAVRYTGSSMNPARSFGPALLSGHWENHWVYWLGPSLGGISAAVLYNNSFAALFLEDDDYILDGYSQTELKDRPQDRATDL